MLRTKLFLPGLAMALVGGAFAQDGTDTCTTPTAIGEGTFTFDTTTMVGNNDLPGCDSNLIGTVLMNKDMFWVYTATVAGDLQIDTDGSSFDTQLAVYDGVDCTAICVDNDDDDGLGLQSLLFVTGVSIGDQFLIQVGGYNVAAGAGLLNITPYIDPCLSAIDDGFEQNDTCAAPAAITPGFYSGLWASASDPDFYSIVVAAGDQLDVDLQNVTNFNIDFNVYDGTCTLINSPLDDFSYYNGTAGPVTITFEAFVNGGTMLCTNYDIDVLMSTPPPPPANDTCATATPITGTGLFPWDNTSATTSGFLGSTGTYATIKSDLFYQWTVPVAGDYVFDTFGSTFDTKLAVHGGVGCAATFIAYDDDSANPFTVQSEVFANGLLAGDMVLIQVGSYSTTFQAAGDLNITQYVDPCGASAVDDGLEQNDTCVAPYAMAAGFYANLWVSDTDPDFYSFTIPAGDIMTVTMTQLTENTDINLYDAGCALISNEFGSFTYSNLSASPETVVLEFFNNPTNSTCSTYDLDISSAPDPCAGSDDGLEENDDCASATPVADGTYSGLFVAKSDKDHYSLCVADGATVTLDILFSNTSGDLDAFLREATSTQCGLGNGTEELADGFSVTDNENLVWTNTLGYDADVVLEVNVWTGTASDCNTYDLVVSGSGCGPVSVGTPFCDPANNNSTGVPAILTGSWGSGVGSDLHLEMNDGVPGQLAYMLVGNEATIGFTIAGANGPLCLVGTPTALFYRYNVPGPGNSIGGFDGTATYINVSGTSTTGFGFDVPTLIPAGVPFAIMAGDTWHFQGWYRDTPAGSGQSNFTNGLSVTF